MENNSFPFLDKVVECDDEAVRLQGGTDHTNGCVEFCYREQWVGVCSDMWSINEARVVCTQLNYDPKGK